MDVTREQVLAFRVRAQELDRPDAAERSTGATILDLGVQDSGPDGARWALALRGWSPDPDDLVTTWSIRGAPHAYRRSQAAAMATAVAPLSEADAAKRVFDAARPLKQAGIPVLDALDHVAEEMRSVVARPTVKGDLSGALNERLPGPYQRYCRPCDAVHVYEQTFRLAALRAGLELRPGTSPPVLERIPRWRGPAADVDPALDPVRGMLRLLGPCTPQLVAGYLDAPVKDVKQHWPADVEPVTVEGQVRHVLTADMERLSGATTAEDVVRLLGPFDLFLQARDRELIVPDESHRKDLWRVLGRPGAVLVGNEVLGSWRPRAAGRKLRIAVDAWGALPDLTEQAERLAAFRGVTFAGFTDG